MYTLLYLKWITNKNQLYSPWNSAQCSVPAWMGAGLGENGYVYVYDWVPLLLTWNCHNIIDWLFSSVQLLSHVQVFVTPWTAARQAPLSITNSQSLLRLMSIESVMPSNHLVLCCPLLLLPSIFPSIRVFFSESVLRIRWPKYRIFSFSISPSNEYSGLISFRIDWFDLLAVQGTLKSLLQHHSSKALILQHSAFLQSNSHIHTWLLEKPKLWLVGAFFAK